jgi:PleD family two-component response regulator
VAPFPYGKRSRMKKVFTTGDVARICRATINTVVKWFDNGELNGYRIPSSRARRIPKRDLLSFMKEHNFPMDEVASDKTRILVVDSDKKVRALFRKAFSNKDNYILEYATSGFEAGLKAAETMPDVIFLNVDLGDVDQRRICKVLQGKEETGHVTAIATSEKLTKEDIRKLKKLGFAEALSKPLKTQTIRQIVNRNAP